MGGIINGGRMKGASSSKTGSAGRGGGGPKIRIQYVDDEPALLEITKAYMESSGDYVIDTYESAAKAIAEFDEEIHKAVVSDYKMPDMDGIELLKALRAKGSDVPFILFTGKGREEIAIEALNNGADFYLKKGGDPRSQFAELANMIAQAVGKRETEEALSYNLRHFRALIENATDMVLEVDGRGVVKYVSPSVRTVLGYEADDLLGEPLMRYVHPAEVEEAARLLGSLRESDVIPLTEIRIRAKDGSWRILESSAAKLQNGELTIVINARDVSERRKMVDRLNRLNRMLALISEINQTIVRTKDRATLFRRLCEIAVDRGDLRMAWVGLVDPRTRTIRPVASCGKDQEYLEGLSISIDDIPEGRGPIGIAVRMNRVSVVDDIATNELMGPWKERAARIGFHSTAGLPIRLHGRPIGALGIYSPEVGAFDEEMIRLLEEAAEDISLAISSIDIEDRHRETEARLAESEERFRTAFDEADIGMVLVGPDSRFIDVNRSFCTMLGHSKEELMRMGFIGVTHPEDASMSTEWVQNMLAGKEAPKRIQKRYVAKDGAVVWGEVSTTLLRDREGKPRYFMTEIQNITERKRAERQREDLQRSLELSRRRLTLLTEMTRHDVENQLTAAEGYVQLAGMRAQGAEGQKSLERMRTALGNIKRLIEFTKVYQELGVQSPEWQNVARSVASAAGQLPMGAIQVNVECADVEILADRLLERVFRNLIENSMKHGERVTRLTISCERSGDGLRVVYEDDGVGIPDVDKGRLFGKGFGRDHGVGLFLAREVLETTGITIIENGVHGRGARFEMTVPADGWRAPGG